MRGVGKEQSRELKSLRIKLKCEKVKGKRVKGKSKTKLFEGLRKIKAKNYKARDNWWP